MTVLTLTLPSVTVTLSYCLSVCPVCNLDLVSGKGMINHAKMIKFINFTSQP